MEGERNDAINNNIIDNYCTDGSTNEIKDVPGDDSVESHTDENKQTEKVMEENEEVTTAGIKIIVETCDSDAEDESNQERTRHEVIFSVLSSNMKWNKEESDVKRK